MQFRVGVRLADVCVDTLDIEPYGIVRVNGWSLQGLETVQKELGVAADKPLPLQAAFLTVRPDVAPALDKPDDLRGFLLEYSARELPEALTITWRGEEVASLDSLDLPFDELVLPEYAALLDLEEVWHREHIYGQGPPVSRPHSEILALARTLEGPVLDFGCGSGALVRALREAGIEASGIELDRPEIVESLAEDVRDHVTLYDGSFPIPFEDDAFGGVVATEVVEHLQDYRAAIGELFRVARRDVLITVPDMAAIPMLAHLGVVPWHLLEATHVNFFTSGSLRRVLQAWSERVRLFRVCTLYLQGSLVPSSLAALARVRS